MNEDWILLQLSTEVIPKGVPESGKQVLEDPTESKSGGWNCPIVWNSEWGIKHFDPDMKRCPTDEVTFALTGSLDWMFCTPGPLSCCMSSIIVIGVN